MASRKRLIIHLGLPRTGTTAIQGFLRHNEAALLEHGIWYPKLDAARYVVPTRPEASRKAEATIANLSAGVHHLLLAMALSQTAATEQRLGFKVEPKVWNDFSQEFSDRNFHTAILSYEGFGGNPDGYKINGFIEKFNQYSIEGIIYHRRYDSWVKSLYEHNIRGKERYSFDFDRFTQNSNIKIFPFSERLSMIRKNFGLNMLHVRSFDLVSEKDNLLEDFFAALELQQIWLKIAPKKQRRKNSSLQPSQSLVLQQLNRWGLADEEFVEIRQAFTRLAMRSRGEDPYSLVPPSTQARLEALADSEAENLRLLYGITAASRKVDPNAPFRPYQLTRARFDEMIRSIENEIGPRLRDELLGRSRDFEI